MSSFVQTNSVNQLLGGRRSVAGAMGKVGRSEGTGLSPYL